MHTTSRRIRQQALERHIRRIQRSIQELETEQQRFSRYRPALLFGGLILSYWLGWTAVIVAALLITIEVIYYQRLGKILRKHHLWLNIKRTQFARMTLDWENIPQTFRQASDATHPFDVDLDITGPRSLFHLLDTAVSQQGSQRLRQWLLTTTPDPEKMTARQQIIQELRPLSRFRDKLLLHFTLVSKEQLDSDKLLRWLRESPGTVFTRPLWISAGLACLNIGLFLGSMFQGWPTFWLISLAIYLAIYLSHLPAMSKRFDAVMVFYDELNRFKAVLAYLETYHYGKHEHLKQLCRPFFHKETLPSHYLKKATWLTSGVGLRMNPIVGFFLNLLIPWDFWTASRITSYQQELAPLFAAWVEAWTELEALVSLANFAYLNPDYTFPVIFTADEASTALFQASELGHPLIPPERKVCNDFSFTYSGEIGLLTGSNMAGKSTFLKTVGSNLCLAYAGGVVNAQTLQTRLFRIYSCIQIHDSVTDGFSFFYAEVKRLRGILEALQMEHPLPVFFLIDEIFKGTNSRERLIGSRSYIHRISHLPGVGLIATHDVELGQLAKQIPGLRNAHFRDAVEDGKMVFDYLLHPGVCATTNALRIMRMEGLPVEMSFEHSESLTGQHQCDT